MKRLFAMGIFALVLGGSGFAQGGGAAGSAGNTGDQQRCQGHRRDSVKIGAMFTASGPMGGYGRHGRQAIQLAVDEINAAGGINGRPVAFYFEDDHLNADSVRQIADRFINRSRVDFLMGPTSSGLAVILSDIAKTGKIPLILTQAADVALTGTGFHDYIFGTLSNSMMHSRAGAYVAAELPFTKWAAIGPNYNYGRSSWAMFRDKLLELRPEIMVVDTMFPPLMSTDFTDYINRLIAVAPEAVWAPLWGNDAVLFIKQALAIDAGFFSRIQFFIPDGASLEVLDPVGADMPDNIYMSARAYFGSPNTDDNVSFAEAYTNRFNELPDYMATETYAGVYFIKKTAERAGSVRADCFVAAAEREPVAWNSPEGWKVLRKEDHQVVEDVLWGRTLFSIGDTRAGVIDIRSIQAEMICRTPGELTAIVHPAESERIIHRFAGELEHVDYSPEGRALRRR